jgi:ribosomal peptide maturation radical SAM protein 1
MPFGHLFSPSIALSLLKAELAAQGMPAQIRYFSIRFAELIGQHFYYGLSAESRPSIEDLAGEWIFSRALFETGFRDEDYINDILGRRVTWTTNEGARPASPALIGRVLRAQEKVDDFLLWCLDEILRLRPRLVGFTSVFQQHVASLALARLVKRALPETFIVFGGANCEGVMGAETVRQFPFVDAAVSGEADLVFPELVRRVLGGQPVSGLPGVRTREGITTEFGDGRFSGGPMVRDLDALPYPDYRDYFEQFEASRFGGDWQPSIPFETSRGCWWGERMHCTFCGLNGQAMAFRSKSARRALDELACLTERHPGCDVDVTDSILNMSYFKDFVPELAARPSGPPLFFEVKANLKKDQLRMLRDAGIRTIQPGIESFSDPVLKLMRKGVSALQNIQLLKWCKELGVEPSWNLLWGFPGEPPEEYNRMADLVPLISHLPPPEGYGMIRVDRFSPNFDDAERLGLEDVVPLPPYGYIYPLAGEALANLAYFFTFRYREPRDLRGYVGHLASRLRAWRRAWQRHDLFLVDTDECLLVWDLRPASGAPLTLLRGVDRILYLACDSACDLRQLTERLDRDSPGALPPDTIARRLSPLLDRGLLVTDGSRYLSLAIPLGEYSPSETVVTRFYELARTLGRRVPGGWLVSSEARHAARRNRTVPSLRSRRRRSIRARTWGRLRAHQFSVDDRGDVLIRRTGPCTNKKGGRDGSQEKDPQEVP